jgi:hypothetical protein
MKRIVYINGYVIVDADTSEEAEEIVLKKLEGLEQDGYSLEVTASRTAK